MKLLFTDVTNQSSFKEIQLLKEAVIHDDRYGTVRIQKKC